ncbi:hypothetical protein Pla22_24350 [Rubripirellula amarantea]|uniref:Uncharacterized protein n=1 Tax=Rubripirellula amarantea TaxID=2527999 RepID=A0A5C5WXD8_9BACT|nr:hypothetical protein [Rubripirellula amarantea]TWT54781.1 hypothetical protein Pla22_24350 [Rubripirellula amarantea]
MNLKTQKTRQTRRNTRRRRKSRVENLESRMLLAASLDTFGYEDWDHDSANQALAIMVEYSDVPFAPEQTEAYYEKIVFGTDQVSVNGYVQSNSRAISSLTPFADGVGNPTDGIVRVQVPDDPESPSVDESTRAAHEKPAAIGEILYAFLRTPSNGKFVQADPVSGDLNTTFDPNDGDGIRKTSRTGDATYQIVDLSAGGLFFDDVVKLKSVSGTYFTESGTGVQHDARDPLDAIKFTIEHERGHERARTGTRTQ